MFLSQATQKMNSVQFSTATVTIDVLVKSLNPPEFQRSEYIGTVTGVGNMAVDPKNEPLQILATDDDYAAVGVKHRFQTLLFPNISIIVFLWCDQPG